MRMALLYLIFILRKILYLCENNFNILVSHRILTLLEVLAEDWMKFST